MQLHELKTQFKRKDKKRIARGGKRGTTSGRGQKGQKSRAGRRIKSAERVLIQRLPKLRGSGNKPLLKKTIVVNVGDLNKLTGSAVNKKNLLEAGFIRKINGSIKILGNGEIKKAFQVEGLEVSKNARKKIEAAGGKVI